MRRVDDAHAALAQLGHDGIRAVSGVGLALYMTMFVKKTKALGIE